ncbi:MAG: TIGR02996 domain-containing protein, partial [Planctomycetia bacterium]|nr:TIGR02996 domain-containing protein [Planctomycetia bacterium]
MTDREALYRAVLDSPDDDTLRLVYADALEEAGDPEQAIVIRSHVELSRLPEYDPRWVRARHHEREKLPNPAWTHELELPDGISWTSEPFRRGFPAAIWADNAAFVAHADELFARYPIESLELDVIPIANIRELAACPHLERLTSLSLAQGASAQTVQRLLASPHLTRLRELHLGSEMTTQAAITAVARSRVFRQLTALSVRSDARGSGTMASALATHANPPRLKKLHLASNRLMAESLKPLVSSAALQTVEDFDLSDNNL